MSDENKLNPDIKKLDVGVKTLRTVDILPLSMADQGKMTEIIAEAMATFLQHDMDSLKDLQVVTVMVKLIKDNIEKMLPLVLDDGVTVTLEELTNNQFSQLVDYIFEVNYEGIIGNFQKLAEKVRKVLPRQKSSPESASASPSTDWRISSEGVIPKEDSQPGK